MAARRKPTSVTLRSYQVGFGDCFLLTVHYGEGEGHPARHVLIDFGSTSLRTDARGRQLPSLLEVAQDVREITGGKLHVVVATHRHADHVSGFAGAPGRVIRELAPDVVIQPWTEDPGAEGDATRASASRQRTRAFQRALHSMHDLAAHALEEWKGLRLRVPRAVAAEIEFLAADNLKNRAAVEALAAMGRRRIYAHHGLPVRVADVLPGVGIRVLGPPNLEQTREIERQRARDPDEFWHVQAAAARMAARTAVGRGRRMLSKGKAAPVGEIPLAARRFVARLEAIRGEELLAIVRMLDEVMNNTSLILLFQVGRARLLFPGDAQIENWTYALRDARDHEEVRTLLAGVHLYKVGHHGSLNATPKTLWGLFEHKGAPDQAARLQTVLSTKKGKHGQAQRNTEVPRRTLVQELEASSALTTTETLKTRRSAAGLRDLCHVVRLQA